MKHRVWPFSDPASVGELLLSVQLQIVYNPEHQQLLHLETSAVYSLRLIWTRPNTCRARGPPISLRWSHAAGKPAYQGGRGSGVLNVSSGPFNITGGTTVTKDC